MSVSAPDKHRLFSKLDEPFGATSKTRPKFGGILLRTFETRKNVWTGGSQLGPFPGNMGTTHLTLAFEMFKHSHAILSRHNFLTYRQFFNLLL